LPEGVSVLSIEKQRETSSIAEDRNLSRTEASGIKSGRPSSAKRQLNVTVVKNM